MATASISAEVVEVVPQTAPEPHKALNPLTVEVPHTAPLPHSALVPHTAPEPARKVLVPHTAPEPHKALLPLTNAFSVPVAGSSDE